MSTSFSYDCKVNGILAQASHINIQQQTLAGIVYPRETICEMFHLRDVKYAVLLETRCLSK